VEMIPHNIADEGDDLAQPVLLKALQLAPTISTQL
jgi:DNA polymerase IIIc chi subunit